MLYIIFLIYKHMRHLKRYNEELKPETYKTAGERLIGRGHEQRGTKLQQYGHDVAGDLISFWVGECKTRSAFYLPLEFSKAHTTARIKLGGETGEWYVLDGSDYYTEKISEKMTDLFESFKNGGCELYFDVQLYFKLSPRQKLLFKDLQGKINRRQTSGHESGMTDQFIIKKLSESYSDIPLVSFRFYISENLYWHDEDDNSYIPTQEQFYEQFKYTFSPSVYTIKGSPMKEYIGSGRPDTNHDLIATGCSRKEGVKIKNIILSDVIKDIKPIIHELFSEHIQSDADIFEKAMNKLSNIKVNSLYRDKVEYKHDEYNFKKQFVDN